MTYLQAIVIAIIEGLTEFLPISSTYHMKLTSVIMGIKDNDEFIKLFIESIQFGAIISVIVLYWRKFLDFTKLSFYYKI
ncbi:MAG: undecaprenyl-diphosphate phosphatase, partial [Bacteroidota bacterium]